ncbi:MAG: peptidylprolyl isomerase [Sphingomonadales bacterium]|nr:peptidylprolyl isomerase [Sphingomonadales bacterium]MDE2568915.1 peptidylprolyl isomerase [Sphingomonadales bacterium]
MLSRTLALFGSVALAIGALTASPAIAKNKPATPPAPAAAAPSEAAPAMPPEVTAAQTNNWAVDFNTADDPGNILVLDLSDGGRVEIRLEPTWAPKTVERIKTLAEQGFYNGIIFHRVIDGFMAQTGDPTGTGQGGSNLPDLQAEFNGAPHLRGTVSMARTDNPNSANSQFFIMFYPRFALDHKYTNFGRVISGMQYVDAIQRGEPPANPTKILQASLASDNKAPPAQGAPAADKSITADMLSKPQPN